MGVLFVLQVQSRDNLGIAVVYNNGSTHIFRVEPTTTDSNENVSRQVRRLIVKVVKDNLSYIRYNILCMSSYDLFDYCRCPLSY